MTALERGECVWVQQCAAGDAHGDDAEAAPDHLTGEVDDRAAEHGAEVGHDLGDGDGIGGKAELVLQHGGVQVLRAVRHEVEPGHEQDEVGEQQPVVAERDLALTKKDAGGVLTTQLGVLA